jgi:hypothetical protein
MDTYAASGTITAVTGAPGDTALGILASPLTRGKLHFFLLTVPGVPVADNVLEWLIRRFTVDGTRTVVVPTLLDPAAPPAQLGAGQNYTVEPTYSAVFLFDEGVHQRSLYQWNAAPGKEIVIPAVAGQGVGFTPIHAAYGGTASVVAHWQE